MKIRTRFITVMLLFGALLAVVTISLINISRQADAAGDQELLALTISNEISELSFHEYEYIIYEDEAQLLKWQKIYASILSHADGLKAKTAQQEELVRSIRTNAKDLKDVFEDVATALQTMAEAPDRRLIRLFWDRIADENMALASDAFNLADIRGDEEHALQGASSTVIVALFGVFIAYSIVNFFLMQRRVLKGIVTLQEGAAAIGSGNLDFRIEGGDDEFGALALSFNRMAANIKSVTAFKAELEEEIYERKKAEEALRGTEKHMRSLIMELEEADRNKDNFLSTLSHELRNPLAAISAGLQLMDVTRDSNLTRNAKEIINRQMNLLCRLVDELLDLTRITHNKIQLKKERLELNALVLLAAEDIMPAFIAKGITLETQTGGELYVNADSARLKQIIGNLMHNAQKFTDPGGKVILSAYRKRGMAVVSIEDNGIGIRPEILPKLFKPFTQVETSLDRSAGGLGLGLAIAKGLAELHDGMVSVFSEGEAGGSTFYIKLPIDRNETERQERDLGETGTASSLKVLIIEDNRDYSDLLSTMLELQGHETAAAHDGIKGIEKAKELLPDAIICDIGLPGINGYEVARYLREDDRLKGIFLIAMTGYAGPQDIEVALAAGFDSHIAKPADLEKLKQILARV